MLSVSLIKEISLFTEVHILLFGLMSPTFIFAKILKRKFDKNKVIRRSNWIYFLFSSLCVLAAYEVFNFSLPTIDESGMIARILSVVLLSRCSEILYAFLIDAYDKISKGDTDKASSNAKSWWKLELGSEKIEMHHRIVLALRSYIELVFNFAILYLLLPITSWKELCEPLNIMETLYFSGVTVTTLGYGDITPTHWFSQFLSVYEVFCGFTLLVVCFAVYLSRKSN
jgi:voltage-gated potassium channel